MDARLARAALLAAIVLSLGARYRTPNFVVDAATPDIAEQVGRAAEIYRRDLATEWLGSEMRRWAEPCPISVKVAPNLGAGGATSFLFDRGEVYGWRMEIQGSLERVLDSVLPHEVTHTIFATHFRQPLPRWADEGACTVVEHPGERAKQQQMLVHFLRTGRGIPFSRMFAMTEYPPDILPLYSQGYSLATFLIEQGGKRKYLDYLADGLKRDDWVAATRRHYGYANLGQLQNSWLDWVRQGSPASAEEPKSTPASLAANRRPRPEPNLIYRGQSEDPQPASAGKLIPVHPDKSGERRGEDAPDRWEEPPPVWGIEVSASKGWRSTGDNPAEDAGHGDEGQEKLLSLKAASPDTPSQPPANANAAGSETPKPGETGLVLREWSRSQQPESSAAQPSRPRSPVLDASAPATVLRR